MTPFAWRASESAQLALKNTPELNIETDFILTLAIKTPIFL
jgi:23S rRNA (guanine745-N1)-methyltransferase